MRRAGTDRNPARAPDTREVESRMLNVTVATPSSASVPARTLHNYCTGS
jgi:hypothetical protein